MTQPPRPFSPPAAPALRRRKTLWAALLPAAAAGLALALGGCTGHPSEGAARGAAGGVAGVLALGSPAVVAVPAGAATGATANSLWEAWNRRRGQCAQLSRCVY